MTHYDAIGDSRHDAWGHGSVMDAGNAAGRRESNHGIRQGYDLIRSTEIGPVRRDNAFAEEQFMRNRSCGLFAATLLFAGSAAFALSTDVPSTGLPSASMYSATLLPELDGVVSWKTLAQVEPVKQGDRMAPKFSDAILGLDTKVVRVQGFMVPLDLGEGQKRFLLTAAPPHCPFCLPAGPEAMVEVIAKKPVDYSFEPVILGGKFAVLKNDPSGVLYRLSEAEPIVRKAH